MCPLPSAISFRRGCLQVCLLPVREAQAPPKLSPTLLAFRVELHQVFQLLHSNLLLSLCRLFLLVYLKELCIESLLFFLELLLGLLQLDILVLHCLHFLVQLFSFLLYLLNSVSQLNSSGLHGFARISQICLLLFTSLDRCLGLCYFLLHLVELSFALIQLVCCALSSCGLSGACLCGWRWSRQPCTSLQYGNSHTLRLLLLHNFVLLFDICRPSKLRFPSASGQQNHSSLAFLRPRLVLISILLIIVNRW
mmetsp:Transcript_61381/g.146245  ORF Transcript_61381/g.146245 Transcript_61381/m.146245 type:complete len:251 (-) Transcript_61381:634-1386(-)